MTDKSPASASITELETTQPTVQSCLVEFVRPGEAERAQLLANGMDYNGKDLVCRMTEPSRGFSGRQGVGYIGY